MLSNGSRGTLISYTDHSVQRRFKSNAPTDWISQHCLLITWPSKRICSSELVPRGSLNWSERINGPCGAIQMSHMVSFRFWRINIISNIFRTFHIVLEENYIAIIIVIELSPSPTSQAIILAFTQAYITCLYFYIHNIINGQFIAGLWFNSAIIF